MSEAMDVERVVREVLARLNVGSAAAVAQPTETKVKRTEAGRPVSEDRAELALGDKLVTLAALEGRLAGVKQVIVQAKAVLTPSARDLLRAKKITVVRGSANGAKG